MRLAWQQAWRTLRQSPMVFVLTVTLLLAAALVPTFNGHGFSDARESAYGIPVEFELSSGPELARDSIIIQLRKLDNIKDIVTLTPGDVRREVLAELGDSLADVLSEQDFPTIVRFRFLARNTAELQAFAAKWSRAAGVARTVYPEEIALRWLPSEEATPALDGPKLWMIAGTSWALAGLCLRAMFLRRGATWRLFIWSGCSHSMMFFVRLWLGLLAGIFAALVWCLTVLAVGTPAPAKSLEFGAGLLWAVLLGVTAGLWLAGTRRLEAEA